MNVKVFALFLSALPFVAGITAIGYGIYWLFNKQAKQRHINELRKQLDKLAPSDPEYNDVRRLYFSAMQDITIHDHSNIVDHSCHCDRNDMNGGGT